MRRPTDRLVQRVIVQALAPRGPVKRLSTAHALALAARQRRDQQVRVIRRTPDAAARAPALAWKPCDPMRSGRFRASFPDPEEGRPG